MNKNIPIKAPEVAMPYQVEPCLQHTAENNPSSVISRLNVGDRVQKSLNCDYEIDDFNVYQHLKGYDPECPEAIPYGPVFRALKVVPFANMPLFRKSARKENGKKIVSFSEVLKSGKGECLEKAILMQLASQDLRRSFLIQGSLENGNEQGAEPHAYNVLFQENQPFLVDASNPLAVDKTGKVTHPYCAPIWGLNLDSEKFLVSDEWAQGRSYFLEL